MFKLFSGGNKQQQQQQQQQPSKPTPQQVQSKELDNEKAKVNIAKQLAFLDGASEKYEAKIEKLDNEIKSLVKQKKKAQAKYKILELKGLQKVVADFETKKIVMIDMQLKLEVANNDINAVNVMKDANKVLKQQEELAEDLADQMADYSEYVQGQEEVNDLWKQIAEKTTNSEDVDNVLDKYEQEIAQEEANMVKAQFDQIPMANVPMQQQQQQQKQQLPQQKQKDDSLQLVLESFN